MPTTARLGLAAAWCLIPTIVFLGLVDTRRTPTGDFGPWTTFLIVCGGAALLGLGAALLAGGWRRCPQPARWIMAGFAALVVWGLISALTHTQYAHDRIGDLGSIVVPQLYIVVPLLSALTACALGWVFAHGAPAAQLPKLMAAMGWSMLAVAAIAVVRMGLQGQLGGRLNTAFSGAASMPLALLLAAACFAGLACQRVSPRINGTAAGLALLALVATGSRMGVLLAVVFVVVLALRWRPQRRHLPLVLGGAAGLLAGVVALALAVPELGRLLTFTDEYRARNTATGLTAWSQDLWSMAFGSGQGVLWPWQAYENGLVPLVADWDLVTPWGPALPSPHSTWLWALAELGILGLALLIAVFAVVVRVIARGVPIIARPLAIALVLSGLAFATDTHLVKNFPVAVVWWFSVFTVIQLAANQSPTKGSRP